VIVQTRQHLLEQLVVHIQELHEAREAGLKQAAHFVVATQANQNVEGVLWCRLS